MLRIRFQRVGRKNRPAYRIVVAEKARAVKGKFLEVLGSYDPIKKTTMLEKERVQHWLKVGAQPSQSIARFLKTQGFADMDKYLEYVTFSKPAKEAEGQAA